MAARLRIVVGFKPDGTPEPLYLGDSGQDAMAAYESPTHETHSRVEYFQFPQASKRRNLVAPAPAEEVAEIEPQAGDPEQPTKKSISKSKKKDA